MPWETPTLKRCRELVRDDITSSLYGAAFIGNNVLRVMSDVMAGTQHHVLTFIEWLATQFLPDTAEHEWLERHGDIWLVNADGSVGRKMATLATGLADFYSIGPGITVPNGTQLEYNQVGYATTEDMVTGGSNPTPVPIRALDPGVQGNVRAGLSLGLPVPIVGIDQVMTQELTGGTDEENDVDLRIRVLERIRQPPQGGAAHDYVRWAKAVPGVTRAWVYPNEMGIGTVTIRVMMDVVRADNDGFPFEQDLAPVYAYLDTVRPVAVKDFWVLAPIKQFIDVHINNLIPDNAQTRAAIEESMQTMLYNLAKPGQTIFAGWKHAAVQNTPGVISFSTVSCDDDEMETPGHMAVLGDIVYDGIVTD